MNPSNYTIRVACLGLLFVLVTPARADVVTNVVWRTEMPTNIHAFFRTTIEEMAGQVAVRTNTRPSAAGKSKYQPPPTPTNRTEWVARQLRTLETLRQLPWPHLDGWERVQYRPNPKNSPPAKTNLLFTAWLVARTPQAFHFCPQEPWSEPTSSLNSRGAEWVTEVRPINFAEELRTTLAFAEQAERGGGSAPFEQLRLWNYYRTPIAFRLAYDAFWFGHTNEAQALLRHALREDITGEKFAQMAITAARSASVQAMQQLVSDAARSEMLATWERYVRIFPQSPNHTEARDIVETLRQQVAEFAALKQAEVENPEALPPAARAEYYLARFPNVRRTDRYSSVPAEMDLRDRVKQLGTNAVPALLVHLTDRRLTRVNDVIGGPPRFVARVQDLALECLQEIAHTSFFRRDFSDQQFSSAPAAKRGQVIREATEWWRTTASLSPLQRELAQLDKLSLYDRIRAVEGLERKHPGEVKALEYLQKWAAKASNHDRSELAPALAARGDLSLLPVLRAQLGRDSIADGNIRANLLYFGGAEDYAAVRRNLWKEQAEESRNQLQPFELVLPRLQELAGRGGGTNFLAVPLLIDALDRFRITPKSTTSERLQAVTATDQALLQLARLTGQTNDYRTNAALWAKVTSLDRWLNTWETTGRTKFLAAHPEVEPVLFDEPIAPDSLKPRTPDKTVTVFSANRAAAVQYLVPGDRLPELLKSSAACGRRYGSVEIYRFVSEEAEEKWFTQTAPKWHREQRPYAPPAKPGSKVKYTPQSVISVAMRADLGMAGAAPEGPGRFWAMGFPGSPWPTRFDGKHWRPVEESAMTGFPSLTPEFRITLALERDAMLCQHTDGDVLLHDADGWCPVLLHKERKWQNLARLRKYVSTTPVWQPASRSAFVKDAADNLWASHPLVGLSVFDKNGVAVAPWPELEKLRSNGESIALVPLGKGRTVLAINRGSGHNALLSAMDGPPRKLADITLPLDTRALTHVMKGASDRWWLVAHTNSVSVDGRAQAVEELPGQLVGEASDKSRWLMHDAGTLRSSLSRVVKDKPEAALAHPGLEAHAVLAPDHTLWTVNRGQLLRFGMREGKLSVLERWALTDYDQVSLWCEPSGRLWLRTGLPGYSRGTLTCLPARAKAD